MLTPVFAIADLVDVFVSFEFPHVTASIRRSSLVWLFQNKGLQVSRSQQLSPSAGAYSDLIISKNFDPR